MSLSNGFLNARFPGGQKLCLLYLICHVPALHPHNKP